MLAIPFFVMSGSVMNYGGIADKLMDFCEAQGAALRGHTLCWYQQTPDFWFHDKETGALVSRDALLARMEDYITAVVSHCKGRVAVWDVVNEAISDSSGLRREDGGCFYPAIIGDLDGDGNDWDYIEKAFEFAHAADPDARLFLNEYSLESNKRKLDDFCRMLTDLMEKGVPVHGVGIQLHGNLSGPYASDVRRCIERLAQYKQYDPSFCVQITEMDLSIFASGDQKTRKALDTTTQAMLAQPACRLAIVPSPVSFCLPKTLPKVCLPISGILCSCGTPSLSVR